MSDDDFETLIDNMRYEVTDLRTGETVVDGEASEFLRQRMRDKRDRERGPSDG
jgi:hypothetical protein